MHRCLDIGAHMSRGGGEGGNPPPEGPPLFNNERTLIYCIPPLAPPKKQLLAHVCMSAQIGCVRYVGKYYSKNKNILCSMTCGGEQQDE